MNNMNSFIEIYIKNKINECGYDIEEVVLNISSRPEFGDYQFNGVMQMAKQYGKNPREIATEIVEKIKEDNHYEDINIAGPGFINISLSDDSITCTLSSLLIISPTFLSNSTLILPSFFIVGSDIPTLSTPLSSLTITDDCLSDDIKSTL